MNPHALVHSLDSIITFESSRRASKHFSPHTLNTTNGRHKEKQKGVQDYNYPSSKTEKEQKNALSKIQEVLRIGKPQKY